ncbi:MAG: hypothetical protein IJ837_04685 [Clostridia bacterium]|nr:hypothetical protein [Clostridia bacterium]
MIVEYIIMTMLILMVVCLIAGACVYFRMNKVSKIFVEPKSNYPKNMIGVSESKIIQLTIRKEKQPLYIFKDGKKIEYK